MTMTNEEAIKVIKQDSKMRCSRCMHPQELGWCENNCTTKQAITMAIEALQSDNYKFINELIKKIESQERALRAATDIIAKYDTGCEQINQGEKIKRLESADRPTDGDLIIKGAKGIKDGLYNIKDGKLFEYKAKGGTVRTYPIISSADRPKGEWIRTESTKKGQVVYYDYKCSICSHHRNRRMNFCEVCGADMRGEEK